MAKSGDVIENVRMGGRIVFGLTARETAGELLKFDFFLRPHKGVARAHLHPVQEERFRVVSGTMRGTVAGAERTVSVGGSVVVSPGTAHIWWNDSDGEAHLEVEFRPALRTETFFETVFGLARDGAAGADGLPRPLQMAVLLAEYRDEFRPAGVPALVQRAAIAGLAPVARLLGYRGSYARYSRGPAESTDQAL